MDKVEQGIDIEKLRLKTSDGYIIAATKYQPQKAVKGHIVVAGATGVPQRFYRHFAEYAGNKGFTTLTLDYRGIGESKPETLKGFNATYLDWAQKDLAAAVDEMKHDIFPLYLVGHSSGGHAFGMLPNHHLIKKFYTFATGAGWIGWMPYLERVRVQFLWHIILPIIVKYKGFMAWSKLGMGEDLPLIVYQQWKHWCRFPHYFFDDPEAKEIALLYKQIRTPIMAANALDDRWATPDSRNAFMQGYSKTRVETRDIDPSGFPGGIGHLGYFKSHARPLWDDVFNWFTDLKK